MGMCCVCCAGEVEAKANGSHKDKMKGTVLKLDGVGKTQTIDVDIDYHPGMAPKSCLGVCLSVLVRLAFLGLVWRVILKCADDNNTDNIPGDDAGQWFNHHCAADDKELVKNLAKKDTPWMKLPTFKISVDTKLIQFEQERPSIQKIELVDDTGFTRHPFTSKDADIAGVKSVISKVQIPMGGFDPKLSQVLPATPFESDDIDATFARAAAHRFTSETLKARYQELGIFEAGQPFASHSAHLFARFDPTQLKKLKSCQLQVFMANAAEFYPQLPTWVDSPPDLPSLATSDYTWARKNWLKNPATGEVKFKHGIGMSEYKFLRKAAAEDAGVEPEELAKEKWPRRQPEFNLLTLEKTIATQPDQAKFGLGNCPCNTKTAWQEYYTTISSSYPNARGVSGPAGPRLRGENEFLYPSEYGLDGCKDYSKLVSPDCTDATGQPLPVHKRPAWCDQLWCYVDEEYCDDPIPSSLFQGAFLSYATCSKATPQTANNWVFGAAYSNNFVHSFDKMTCDADPMDKQRAMNQVAIGPSATASIITVIGSQYMGPGSGSLGNGFATDRSQTVGEQLDLAAAQALGKTCAGCYNEERTQQMRCGTCTGTPTQCAAANADEATCLAAGACTYTPATCKFDPFYLLISGVMGQERVKVTAMTDCTASGGTCVTPFINGGLPVAAANQAACASPGIFTAGDGSTSCRTLAIERGQDRIDFTAPPPLDMDIGAAIGIPFPLKAPVAWRCSPKRYWAGDACDCECGAFDPDCLELANDIKGCSATNGEKCSYSGTCVVVGPNEVLDELQWYETDGSWEVPNWISRTLAGFSPTFSTAGSLLSRADISAKCETEMTSCDTACQAELNRALTKGEASGDESAEFVALLACAGTDNSVTGDRSGCGGAMPLRYPCWYDGGYCGVGNGYCDVDGDIRELISPECGYDGGDCLIVDPDKRRDGYPFTPLVWISEDCDQLFLQGESTIAGFIGSEDSFQAAQAAGGGTCPVCPGDTLFGGNPIRNADGDFVCDGAPEGTVDTANDFVLGTDCNAKIGRDCLENEQAIHVYPNFGTPFPPVTPNQCTGGPECRAVAVLNDGGVACLEAHENCSYIQGTQYKLALSAGQAIQEVVYVQQVSQVIAGAQWLAVSASKTPTDPMCVTDDPDVHCEGVADLSSATAGCQAAEYQAAELTGYACTDGSYTTEDECWGAWTADVDGNWNGPLWNPIYSPTPAPCEYIESKFKKSLSEKHISRGSLISSIEPDSMTIVVVPDEGGYEFDSLGPYTVYIRGTSLTVASATVNRRDKVPHQVLTLAQPPEYSVGTTTTLIEDHPRETQTLITMGSDPDRGWKLLDDGIDLLGTVTVPNREPMTINIESVWPSGWRCPEEFFNDGVYCDINCGIFDPDCGRVRNWDDPDYRDEENHDGYWYTNPSLKTCKDDDTEMTCWISEFDEEGDWAGDHQFEAAVDDPSPADPAQPFGWVTWDNVDLDRDGVYDFTSGQLVPSGTEIVLEAGDGVSTPGTYFFKPYVRDHDSDGNPDVPVVPQTSIPTDGLPPIKTPPYHPSTKARYGPEPQCKGVDSADDANCDELGDLSVCASDSLCQVEYPTPDGTNSDVYFGTEYSWHNTMGDLKAMTKWQKAHPAGVDVPQFFDTCDGDEDDDCLPLEVSWRASHLSELPVESWEAGTSSLFMDALEMTKGFYLKESIPKGSRVGTYAMPTELFFEAHPNDNVHEAYASGISPDPLSDFGLSSEANDVKVTRFFDVKMLRDEEPYLPSDRHAPTAAEPMQSPEVLDVDISLFYVPQRELAPNYCPSIELTQKQTPWGDFDAPYGGQDSKEWGIRPGRELKVTGCKNEAVDDSQCLTPDAMKAAFPGQYRAKCSTDMPPTSQFSMSTEIYANNKWIYLREKDGQPISSSWSGYARPMDGSYVRHMWIARFTRSFQSSTTSSLLSECACAYLPPQSAEYTYGFSHIYTFSHALIDDEVENQMAEGMPPTKNTNQDGVKYIYTGATKYRGLGKTNSSSSNSGFPANVPFLESTLRFKLAPEAVEDILDCKSQYWVLDKDWIERTLKEGFPEDFEVAWDYGLVGGSNKQLMLEPGYLYTLAATISIIPVQKKDRFEAVWANKWVAGGQESQTVTRVRTDYFHRREAQVKYEITFDTGAVEYTETHNMPFAALFSNICALTAVIGAAAIILKHIHKATKVHHKVYAQYLNSTAITAAPEQQDSQQEREQRPWRAEIDFMDELTQIRNELAEMHVLLEKSSRMGHLVVKAPLPSRRPSRLNRDGANAARTSGRP